MTGKVGEVGREAGALEAAKGKTGLAGPRRNCGGRGCQRTVATASTAAVVTS
jgi:hypothetical protein